MPHHTRGGGHNPGAGGAAPGEPPAEAVAVRLADEVVLDAGTEVVGPLHAGQQVRVQDHVHLVVRVEAEGADGVVTELRLQPSEAR